jgi:hypothetical protein
VSSCEHSSFFEFKFGHALAARILLQNLVNRGQLLGMPDEKNSKESSFLWGAATVFDIFGRGLLPEWKQKGLDRDADSLAQDGKRIGQDFNRASLRIRGDR